MAGEKLFFFLRLFFQFAFTNKTNALYTRKESTQSRGELLTTRNTSGVMCGMNLIFAIISNFAVYFSIVQLQLIFFCNSF